MKLLNKADEIAKLENKDKIERRINIIEILTAYTVTLHPATGIATHTSMESRQIKIKLDYNKLNRTEIEKKQLNEIIESNDEKYKNSVQTERLEKERS